MHTIDTAASRMDGHLQACIAHMDDIKTMLLAPTNSDGGIIVPKYEKCKYRSTCIHIAKMFLSDLAHQSSSCMQAQHFTSLQVANNNIHNTL